MVDIYLTDKIIINSNKYYYDENNERKIINNKNWHKILSDIGWIKLDKSWIIRLNHMSNEKGNSKWGVLDVIPDGDCFYSVIAEAYNYYYKTIESPVILDSSDIRKEISLQITEKNFEHIMNIYKIEKSMNEFYHKWNIEDIKSFKDLREELKKTGHNYWADHIIIQLFQEKYNMNIIILNQSNLKKNTKIYSLGNELNKEKKTIIMYYIDQIHFKLIGYFNNNSIHTIFNYNELPNEIVKIYELDCR